MSALEIGSKLVELVRKGNSLEAVDDLYDEKIVSIEATGRDELPARMEGIEAIRGKNAWFFDAHEVHSETADGPYAGHGDEQFAVVFEMDVTAKASGERTRMKEVALYTVANGKIVREEFLYLTP